MNLSFFKDIISDTYNRNYLDVILIRNKYDKEYSCINIIYLHHFSKFNNKYGWNKGDRLLKEFAFFLKESYPESLIFRVQGDDFIILNKEHIIIDKEAIQSLDLLNQANVTSSFGHHNLLDENIADMNIMDRHLLSQIADLQKK